MNDKGKLWTLGGPKRPAYSPKLLSEDVIASLVVTVLLVPQGLAYALLADLPPQVGLYAAIFPLIGYAVLGSSRFLAVGPIAIASLMTAEALSHIDPELRIQGAALMAAMSGLMLIILGLFRMGVIANFLSRPVVSGYITGAAILIIFSQLKHILGIRSTGGNAIESLQSIYQNIFDYNWMTLIVGVVAIIVLFVFQRKVSVWLRLAGLPRQLSRTLAKLGPVLVVVGATLAMIHFKLEGWYSVAVIGEVPAGLPPLKSPTISWSLVQELFVPALLVSIVGFVDSISVAQNLAAKRRDRIDPDKELLGLGAANFIAGFNAGYPVSGSLSRTAINFQAGAATRMAGVFTAVLMAITVMFFTGMLTSLPLAALAAMIIVACFSLFEFKELIHTWHYSRADGATAFATLFGVLVFGVEFGVLLGVILSMSLHIKTTLKPHAVIVGQIEGTEHYRDVKRHDIEYDNEIITLRIDESLYFANARFLEDKINDLLADHPHLTDLVLMCPAVNRIDASALESLAEINLRLDGASMRLHMSEVHGVIMDALYHSGFLEKLSGEVFLSQHEAMTYLKAGPETHMETV